jgi:hypothetical protein
MDIRRCYTCKATLPDDKHRQETIKTEGGYEIPVVLCPYHASGVLTIAPAFEHDLQDPA